MVGRLAACETHCRHTTGMTSSRGQTRRKLCYVLSSRYRNSCRLACNGMEGWWCWCCIPIHTHPTSVDAADRHVTNVCFEKMLARALKRAEREHHFQLNESCFRERANERHSRTFNGQLKEGPMKGRGCPLPSFCGQCFLFPAFSLDRNQDTHSLTGW